jgi:hypothetical protein
MLKKLAIVFLKKELKKLDTVKIVDTLLDLIEDKAKELLPKLIEKIQSKLK